MSKHRTQQRTKGFGDIESIDSPSCQSCSAVRDSLPACQDCGLPTCTECLVGVVCPACREPKSGQPIRLPTGVVQDLVLARGAVAVAMASTAPNEAVCLAAAEEAKSVYLAAVLLNDKLDALLQKLGRPVKTM